MKLTLTYAKVFPRKPTQKSDTISIKCQEYGDRYISGFLDASDERRDWKAGMKVEAEVKENGKYLNIVKPKKSDALPNQEQLDIIYKSINDIGDKNIEQDKRLDNHALLLEKLREQNNLLMEKFNEYEAKKLSDQLDEELGENPL